MSMADVQKAIEVLVETKTFSLEGVKAIQELRTLYEDSKKLYDNKCEEYKSLKHQYEKQSSEFTVLVSEVNNIKIREEAVTKREEAITRLEIEKMCADKMVAHTLGMFNTVFANAALKTSVMRSVSLMNPGMPGNNGGSNIPPYIVKDTEIENINKEVGGNE